MEDLSEEQSKFIRSYGSFSPIPVTAGRIGAIFISLNEQTLIFKFTVLVVATILDLGN